MVIIVVLEYDVNPFMRRCSILCNQQSRPSRSGCLFFFRTSLTHSLVVCFCCVCRHALSHDLVLLPATMSNPGQKIVDYLSAMAVFFLVWQLLLRKEKSETSLNHGHDLLSVTASHSNDIQHHPLSKCKAVRTPEFFAALGLIADTTIFLGALSWLRVPAVSVH